MTVQKKARKNISERAKIKLKSMIIISSYP